MTGQPLLPVLRVAVTDEIFFREGTLLHWSSLIFFGRTLWSLWTTLTVQGSDSKRFQVATETSCDE